MLTPAIDTDRFAAPPSNADALRTFNGSTLKRLTGLLALLVLCASCGKDDSPAAGTTDAAPSASAPAGPRDACQLLTAEDARAALGHDVKKTDPANMTGMAMCQYMADNSESVTLQFRPAAAREIDDYAKQYTDALGGTAEPVSGVGERAVLVGDQFVFVSKGHMYILMLGKNLPAPDKSERTRKLAAAILSRL